jgi:arsenate reductase (glutaredoxin)
MNILYGISNCDTVRKTGRWLDQQGKPWQLHDYRKNGLDRVLLEQLLTAFPLAQLVNRRGTTFRQLDPKEQARLDTIEGAFDILIANPALIKRPALRTSQDEWLLGYDQIVEAFPGS